jgi:hypothetical protein
MKITLHTPPGGYEAEAEYRVAEEGEMELVHGMAVKCLVEREGFESIILIPKRQRAELRRYWATINRPGHASHGMRFQFCGREHETFFWSYESGPLSVLLLTDITPIDDPYLDAPPVPEKDWWYGREKSPDKDRPIHYWSGQAWVWVTHCDILPADIWRYQPPAPSGTRTDVGEGEAAK